MNLSPNLPVLRLTLLALGAGVISMIGLSVDANAADQPAKQSHTPYRDIVRKDLPVAWWSFDGKTPEFGTVKGQVEFGQPGPGQKAHKGFAEGNAAAKFDGQGSFIRLADPGDGSQFDFENGDPITIEAWVNPEELKNGQNVYIAGKGRTKNKGFTAENQNFALRLWESGGVARLSFLFRSRAEKDKPADYHRWTSQGGVKPGTGWHHVAVSYVFGKPDSLKGYIDGTPVDGDWDMGGKTDRQPIVDNDEIWVGSSMGGSPGSSFTGWMDEVAIYRRELSLDQLAVRYPVEPYKPAVDEKTLTDGKVRVEIVEDLGVARKWPNRFAKPVDVYEQDALAFFGVPNKYTESGVITDRSNPFLLRAIAKVTIPAGEHRILLRTRGGGRLWMDGKVIATTDFPYTGGGGHNEVDALVDKAHPDIRLLGAGDREKLVPVTGDGKEHLFVFEMIAGDGKARATIGESSVSIATPEGPFSLLSPKLEIALTDAGWDSYRREREEALEALNRDLRLAARKEEDRYWEERHAKARALVAEKNLQPAAPADSNGYPALNEIDRFLAAGWAKPGRGAQAHQGTVSFEKDIKPILADNCFRCHAEKVKGGLRLDDRESALKGGDSELPSIIPGKSAESYLVEVIHPDSEDRMPPKGDALTDEQRTLLAKWIDEGASWTDGAAEPVNLTGKVDDLEFLRRITLDTVGVVPGPEEIQVYLRDKPAERRAKAVDRLLADERWADHWISYWQDVLAENPNILKPSLNNSGPFRFWIHESLQDNKAMDRFVTELVMMEGSEYNGGPAGFAMATQNDVPMAAKAHILGTAFLGVQMECARCHDSPYHSSTQQDLFELAAMLDRASIKIPESSSVPAGSIPSTRKSLITVSLKPGDEIQPAWPFDEFLDGGVDPSLLHSKDDSREKLAVMITSPENLRFAEVSVNRLWKQLVGVGFVDPVDDWEASKPSHPELLRWLACEFIESGYDSKHVVRLILNSHVYQREAVDLKAGESPDYAGPIRRRMTAEQIVDSLFSSVGKPMDVEELTFDIDGTQLDKNMISLGYPKRSWEFASLSNERDRPSLAMPKAQAVVDVLENFGWRSSRQAPASVREQEPNVLQPAVLANGPMSRWVTTLSENSAITGLAADESLELDEFVAEVFLRVLTRRPTQDEQILYAELLSEGFSDRVIPEAEREAPKVLEALGRVSWSNHLSEEANRIKIQMEERAREGDPPTVKLRPEWRQRAEDMVWAMLNSPEMVYIP